MPTYEFRCPHGHEFERFYRSISAAEAQSRLSRVRRDGRARDVRRRRPASSRDRASTSPTTARTRKKERAQPTRRRDGAKSERRSRGGERAASGVRRRAKRVERRRREVRATPKPAESKPAAPPSRAAASERRRSTRCAPSSRARRERSARPTTIEPVLERPRDPSFGDWATNLAMMLAKPLGRKPREIAQRARSRRSTARAAGIATAEIAGPGLHQLPARRRRASRSGLAALVAAGDAVRPHATRARASRSIVEFVSRESDRAAARRPRPPGGARRRDRDAARVDRVERHARVLLQRRRRADREPRAERAGARARARAASRSRFPRAAITASTSARSPQRYVDEHPDDRDGRRPRGDARVRRAGAAQGAGSRPPGVRRASSTPTSSSPRCTPTAGSSDTVDALVAAGTTYEKDGALWLRTTEFGDDKDRVMRKSARRAARTRTSCPTSRTT